MHFAKFKKINICFLCIKFYLKNLSTFINYNKIRKRRELKKAVLKK